MLSFPFPDMQVRGEGSVKPPPLTDLDLAEIRHRAESVQNQQIRTDLFRLLTALDHGLAETTTMQMAFLVPPSAERIDSN